MITSRSAERAAAAAARIPGVLGLAAEASDEASVARAADEAWSRLGGMDLLVNNAGLGMRTVNPRFMVEPQGFWEVPPEGFRAVVDANLTGYFLMARELTPRMLKAGSGRIVNISMNHTTMTRRGFVPYGPSRAGAEALSRIMAADLADTPVRVNMLLPGGATETGMVPDDRPAGSDPDRPGGYGAADRLAGVTAGPGGARRAHRRHRFRGVAGRSCLRAGPVEPGICLILPPSERTCRRLSQEVASRGSSRNRKVINTSAR